MKALISGSNGFVGQALVKRLSDQYQVIPITRELLYNKEELKRLFEKEKPDIAYHLASYGNHSNQKDNELTLKANVLGTFNMFESANCKLFNFSTSSVNLPTQTMYSITKRMGEELSLLYPNVVNVRPYSVFGEGEADFRFIPTVCRSLIFGEELTLDPDPTHDWIYIENFLDVLLNNKDATGTLEIGTGISTRNEDIVRMLVQISGKACKIKRTIGLRTYDNEHWVAPQKLKMKYSLDVGLLRTYKYYERLKN